MALHRYRPGLADGTVWGDKRDADCCVFCPGGEKAGDGRVCDGFDLAAMRAVFENCVPWPDRLVQLETCGLCPDELGGENGGREGPGTVPTAALNAKNI